jgi:uncharacterized protein (DUF2384 family)
MSEQSVPTLGDLKRIAELASALFGRREAVAWLRSPETEFNGRPMTEVLKTKAGADRLEGWLDGFTTGSFR